LIPQTESQFLTDLTLIFPNFYDIKVIADVSMGMFRSSLAILSERLGVYRDDDCEHQAGSDSKITAKCFFELKKYGDFIEACKGDIFGLSKSDIVHNAEMLTGSSSLNNEHPKILLKQKIGVDTNHGSFLVANDQAEYDHFIEVEEEYEDEPGGNGFEMNQLDDDIDVQANMSSGLGQQR